MTRIVTPPVLPASETPLRPSGDARLDGHRVAWLLGIGGVGLGAAAELLLARGLEVGGSESRAAPRTRRLEGLGVRIDHGETGEALPANADLIVASAAIPPSHPQLLEAQRRGLPVWKYADLLGALMADRFAICVAGSHGKTTTSALVASALVHAGRDPSYVVGGDLTDFGSGARSGRGPHFVAEACEYDRSFLRHRPRVAIITNVDADHLDYYRDLEEIEQAFAAFAALLPTDGLLLVHDTCAGLFCARPGIRAPVETYGHTAEADWRVRDARPSGDGNGTEFRLERSGGAFGTFLVPLLGRHNVANAAAAVAALASAGLCADEAAGGLQAFGGVGRRLERVVDRSGILVLDDYGHHPVEVRATVGTLRRAYRGRRIVLIFQPHQASRTQRLLGEFSEALAIADEVWIAPIYFARDGEEARRSVTSDDLAASVHDAGGAAYAFPDFETTIEHALAHIRSGDVVVTMGAGDVDEVARGLADRLP